MVSSPNGVKSNGVNSKWCQVQMVSSPNGVKSNGVNSKWCQLQMGSNGVKSKWCQVQMGSSPNGVKWCQVQMVSSPSGELKPAAPSEWLRDQGSAGRGSAGRGASCTGDCGSSVRMPQSAYLLTCLIAYLLTHLPATAAAASGCPRALTYLLA